MKPRKWKEAEKEMLKDRLLKDGLTIEQVEIPGRKPEGIRRQAVKLFLIERERHPPLTEEQLLLLYGFKAQGLCAKQISDEDLLGPPHRTPTAIQKNLSALGLVNKNRALAAFNRKIWYNGEKEAFAKFLVEKFRKLSTREMADKFGVSKSTVDRWQRKLGVKPSPSEAMAIPSTKEHLKKCIWERDRKKVLAFEKNLALRRKKLLAVAIALRKKRFVPPLEERKCINCGTVWPKRKKFFYYTEILHHRYFMRSCVLCEAKRRHQKRLPMYQQRYAS